MPDKIPMNHGKDLVAAILDHPQGGAEALLEFTGGQETEWLELKAALYPLGGIFNDGEKLDDLRWHVAEAVFAMANSSGGAVIIGVDDHARSVGLEASDPKGILTNEGRDAFNRKVVLSSVVRNRWKTKQVTLEAKAYALRGLVEIRNAKYHGKDIACILTAPIPGNDFLGINVRIPNFDSYFVPVRSQGDTGEVVNLKKPEEYRQHEQGRGEKIQGQYYRCLWEKFLLSLAITEPKQIIQDIDENTEERLSAFCKDIATRLKGLFTIFSPLEAQEEKHCSPASDTGGFDPHADEVRDDFALDVAWETVSWEEQRQPAGIHDNRLTVLSDQGGQKDAPPLRSGGVFDLLRQEDKAILVGEPGSGKTTLLRRMALEDASNYHPGGTLTVYVPLNRFTEMGIRPLVKKFARQSWSVLETLLRKGRLRLLLDAINECPLHLQTRCCQEIQGLLYDYPKMRLVLSSRRFGLQCHLALPTFAVRQLDKLQQEQFLTKYLNDAQNTQRILSHIHGQPGGELLAGNPLLLSMVAVVAGRHAMLPSGRAQLFRQFLKNWYAREQQKEIETGARLRWSFPLTLDALSRLAFTSRQQGLTIMDRSWALRVLAPVLHNDAFAFLERFAQGLLLTLNLEDDTLDFTHETVQEYLAAEYVLTHPGELRYLPADSLSYWLMPLAFAFEMAEKCPEELVHTAWEHIPLLVAVALRDNEMFRQLPIQDHWGVWLKGMILAMRDQDCGKETEQILTHMWYPPMYPLTRTTSDTLQSSAFWYAGAIHHHGRERLVRLQQLILEHEDPWLDLLLPASKGSPEWVQEFNPNQQEMIRCFSHGIHESDVTNLNLNQVALLSRHQILKRHVISMELRDQIATHGNPRQILSIFPRSWRTHIPTLRLREIIAMLTPYHVPWLYRGLINNNEIARKKLLQAWKNINKYWLEEMSEKFFLILFTNKYISNEDIPQNTLNKMIDRMNSSQAWKFVLNKLITKDDIPKEKIHQIVQNMSPDDASRLVECEIITPEDIPEEKKRQILETMTPKECDWLFRNKIINIFDISDNIKNRLILKMKANEVYDLIFHNIISNTDITDEKKNQIVDEMSADDACRLLYRSTIQKNDISRSKMKTLIEEMDIGNATTLVEKNIIQPDEIPQHKIAEFLKRMSWLDFMRLLEAKILTNKNISPKKKLQVIQNMPCDHIFDLIEYNIINIEDVPEKKIDEWIKNIYVIFQIEKDIIKILRHELLINKKNDILQAIFENFDEFYNSLILDLVHHGYIKAGEINNRKIQIIIENLNHIARYESVENLNILVESGLISPEIISQKTKRKLISNIINESLYTISCLWKLAEIGILRKDDFTSEELAIIFDEFISEIFTHKYDDEEIKYVIKKMFEYNFVDLNLEDAITKESFFTKYVMVDSKDKKYPHKVKGIRYFLEMDILKKSDLSFTIIDHLSNSCGIEDAIWFVDNGLMQPEIFSERSRKQFVLEMNRIQIVQLLRRNIISISDLTENQHLWISQHVDESEMVTFLP